MDGKKINKRIVRITFRREKSNRSETEIVEELVNHIIGKVFARYRTP